MGLGSERDLVPLGAGFDIVKRGYSRTQVEEHLERLDSDLRLIAADRDAAMSQAADLARQMERARTDLDELRGQVNRLSLPPRSTVVVSSWRPNTASWWRSPKPSSPREPSRRRTNASRPTRTPRRAATR